MSDSLKKRNEGDETLSQKVHPCDRSLWRERGSCINRSPWVMREGDDLQQTRVGVCREGLRTCGSLGSTSVTQTGLISPTC